MSRLEDREDSSISQIGHLAAMTKIHVEQRPRQRLPQLLVVARHVV